MGACAQLKINHDVILCFIGNIEIRLYKALPISLYSTCFELER